jgi:tetratricopeptide (TPR) repeat protein
MGSLTQTDPVAIDTTVCFSGHQTEDASLKLPSGKSLANLPADADIQTANLTFRTHWSANGQIVSVHREFVSHVETRLCKGQLRIETAAALKQIANDYDKTISLIDTGSIGRKPNVSSGDAKVAQALDKLMEQVSELAVRGQFDAAIKEVDQALELDPENGAVLAVRAGLYAALNKYDTALADMNEAIGLSPSSPDLFSERADIYFSKNDFKRALADMDQAVKLAPSNATYLALRAQIYVYAQEFDAADRDLAAVMTLEPDNAQALAVRCQLDATRKDFDHGLADCTSSINIAPAPRAYAARASIYMATNKLEQALVDINKAMKLAPNDAHLFWMRSWVKNRLGDKAGYNADLQQAERLDPHLGE